MKDSVITAKQKKREIYLVIICLVAAYILNIVGIIKYSSPAKELITQLPLSLLIGVGFYLVIAVLRLIVYLITKLIKKN